MHECIYINFEKQPKLIYDGDQNSGDFLAGQQSLRGGMREAPEVLIVFWIWVVVM